MSQQNINFQKSRIVSTIKLNDPVLTGVNKEINIVLPNTMGFTTSTSYGKVHGTGKGEFNAGVVAQPITYAFTFSVPAVSSSDRLLRTIMATKQTFDAYFSDTETTPSLSEHKLYRECLMKCHINDMSTDYPVGDAPRSSFNGVALNEIFRTPQKTGDLAPVSSDNTYPLGRGLAEGRDTFTETFLDNPETYW